MSWLNEIDAYKDKPASSGSGSRGVKVSAERIAAMDIKQDDSLPIQSLKKARAVALERLAEKMNDLPADKLATAVEQMTKTINLITGKPTENIALRGGLVIASAEQMKEIQDKFS